MVQRNKSRAHQAVITVIIATHAYRSVKMAVILKNIRLQSAHGTACHDKLAAVHSLVSVGRHHTRSYFEPMLQFATNPERQREDSLRNRSAPPFCKDNLPRTQTPFRVTCSPSLTIRDRSIAPRRC